MKKRTLLNLVCVLAFANVAFCQIGIGTINPHPSAIVEIKSTNKGFLPPRLMDFEMEQIENPSPALMVYCKNCCGEGTICVFDGTEWTYLPDCILVDLDRDGVLNESDLDVDNDGVLNTTEHYVCNNAQLDLSGVGTGGETNTINTIHEQILYMNPEGENVVLFSGSSKNAQGDGNGNFKLSNWQPSTAVSYLESYVFLETNKPVVFQLSDFNVSTSNFGGNFEGGQTGDIVKITVDASTSLILDNNSGHNLVLNLTINNGTIKEYELIPEVGVGSHFTNWTLTTTSPVNNIKVDYIQGNPAFTIHVDVLDVQCISVDTDGDGIEDYKDLDSDGNGILDVVENGLPDEDNNGKCDDSDGYYYSTNGVPDLSNNGNGI
ncbi:MAG: hypothetical protein ACPG6V_09645 [Flavobacteriales bacterium]